MQTGRAFPQPELRAAGLAEPPVPRGVSLARGLLLNWPV
jgi:hypothetical protein